MEIRSWEGLQNLICSSSGLCGGETEAQGKKGHTGKEDGAVPGVQVS